MQCCVYLKEMRDGCRSGACVDEIPLLSSLHAIRGPAHYLPTHVYIQTHPPPTLSPTHTLTHPKHTTPSPFQHTSTRKTHRVPQPGQHPHFVPELFNLAARPVLQLLDGDGLPRPEPAEDDACCVVVG